MLYWGYLLARIVARIVPIGVSYWIAERVADSWYALSPRTRGNLAYNLSLVPGTPADERPRALLARRIMRNFARMVTEFVYLPRIDRDTLGRWVHPESFQSLAEAMAGRRAILITCHLGNWELAAAVIAMMGVGLHLVVYDHPDSRVARLFRERREAKGLKVMSVKQAAREITTTLKNRSVAIVGDRDYSGRGKEARFLGADVRVPYAYAGLAVALGVPVIAGFCVRQADGRYDLAFRETVYDPPEDTKTPEEIVRTCLRIFEKGVEKYTEQWYFFERVDRRWGSPRK